MAGDWVKLHRKLIDSQIFAHAGIFRLWCFCLAEANWKDSEWIIPGTLQTIQVKRGQFVTGRESLHERLYGNSYRGDDRPVSRTLWRWLEFLEAQTCITIENVSNRCSVVTVCKYDTYQSSGKSECPTNVQPVSNQCPTGVQPIDQPMSTLEEDKNSLRRKEGKKGKSIVAAVAAERDEGLAEWLVWWNSLKTAGLVPCGVSESEPSAAICEAWKRASTTKAIRELLQDRDAIEREIKASSFCRESWFRLEKLFGGKNRDREYILRKLLDGGYRDRGRKQPDDPRGNIATVESYLEDLKNGSRI